MSEPNPPDTGLEQPRKPTSAQNKRAALGKLIGWGFVLLLVITALIAGRNFLIHPRSEHGKVEANAVGIAPRVSGPIKHLPIIDDQDVKKGDILFEIDPAPYEIALRVARANRDAVAGELINAEKAVAAQKAQVLSATALLAQARTSQAQTEEAYQRIAPLLEKKFTTAEAVDTARHSRDAAVASVAAAQAQTVSAEAAVQDLAAIQAQLKAAEGSVAQAELSLQDCTVRAPFNGRVVGLNISVGAFARTAIDVVTLIDTDDWHVEANFREGELRHIQPGDRAEVEIMTMPGHRFTGEVESIGWGVSDLPKVPFTGLPIIQRELDWATRPVSFDIELLGTVTDAQGGRHLGATATATIDRTAFGLTWNMPVPSGVLVSEQVKIEVDVQVVDEASAKQRGLAA